MKLMLKFGITDKKKNKITLNEKRITSQDSLKIVQTEKLTKYDLLANELGLIYKCSVEIILYVMTWDGIVTNNIIHKKTIETISFDQRRGLESRPNPENRCIRNQHFFKQAFREKDGAKNSKQKINHPLFQKEKPKININEEADLEEETTVVKEVEENA
ncbi:hypothetical protein CWI39_0017p0020 [Hamiltosporidium magnivora]|uniref:Uncharacterized protein n=1 Tax=Hamiltosporidium magnivora TaxID=148818 RepID=A0A4Q9LR84_9MICR|nr:hypothetical protein CWI39_0017p0020 [Hamiltosporidium magnivora]